jgi:hypothetical protein
MGRLIKNHWGRLIILTAAACMLPAQHCQLEAGADRIQTDQVASAVEGFIWPKVFWDFISRNLDAAVAPVPVLQILNLIMAQYRIAALKSVSSYTPSAPSSRRFSIKAQTLQYII